MPPNETVKPGRAIPQRSFLPMVLNSRMSAQTPARRVGPRSVKEEATDPSLEGRAVSSKTWSR
jgi:hypothetical protein